MTHWWREQQAAELPEQEPRRLPSATSRARSLAPRSVALWTHRYVGLLMTVFLVVAGGTGSLLAFYHELDEALNPGLFRVAPPAPGAPLLDVFAQREALTRQLPATVHAYRLGLDARERVASVFEVSALATEKYVGDDEFFVDPYTGRIIGSRRWGDVSQGLRNLMPFIYRLHYSLALGKVGTFLLGVVALLWTIDCFVGAYLTLPSRRRGLGRRGASAWLARWKPAWLVRGGHLFSWVFTWHRASGLWVWALLLAFAWSAVALNLREVYAPVMRATVGLGDYVYPKLRKLELPRLEPGLGWREALLRGRVLMTEQASQRGFEVLAERRLVYHPEVGAFRYSVRSSIDVSDRYPNTTVWFDGQSGVQLGFDSPTGETAGQAITTWIYQLHFASVAVLGFPYRVFVCALGVAISVLCVSGAWVWWVKRRKHARLSPHHRFTG